MREAAERINRTMSDGGLVVVIPTRNRSDLAKKAVESVIGQVDGLVHVLVSDNSTTSESRSDLSGYCHERGDKGLRYVTPPEPLPMAGHWDWAMQQALSLYDDFTHFTFLTDRMLFKPGALRALIEIITAYPDKIVTYMHDMVDDFSLPIVVRQYTWTGNLYEVPSTRLLKMSAQSVMYDTCLPRMLNCIVPRTVLNGIEARFGDIFSFIAPDWSFCYRALEVVESILFHDKAALVHYAQPRSCGQGAHYGITNSAFSNFLQDLGGIRVNFAAPFPEIITVWNAIISEYCHAKEITQSPKFPELDLDNYRRVLAYGVDQIKDPQRQDEMRTLLCARGWKPGEAPLPSAPPPPGVEPFYPRPIEFPNWEEAMNYALHHPRERAAASEHESLIHGVRLPLETPV
jgi:glycosyltransferase involved in cell wall biosynthesis